MSSRPVLIAAAARDPFVSELVRDLQSEGREVLISHDSVGTMKTARVRRPALVVLDTILRDGNAFSLCQQLKADPITGDIPVFFFSVLMARERCGEVGADGFMLKPVEQELLLTRIREVLNCRVMPWHRRAK